MEFMLFFAILAVAFTSWLVIYSNMNMEAFADRDRKAMEDLGSAIQAHIVAASDAHDGFRSDRLIIPEKAGFLDFAVKNSENVFWLTAKGQDYIFHIPYTVGQLQKGRNRLWSVSGVVGIGEFPPVLAGGLALFHQCGNGLDDDGDGLIDDEDGGCYFEYSDPQFDSAIDSEPPSENIPPYVGGGEVYNYYVLCENAQANDLCEVLDPDLGMPFSQRDCCIHTYEQFCAVDYSAYQASGGCQGGKCACPP